MERAFHYATVTDAISELRQQGFIVDFNLKENSLEADSIEFASEEFEILDVYRYEGNSDPADEATVYANCITIRIKRYFSNRLWY